jgi:hypothetical protein
MVFAKQSQFATWAIGHNYLIRKGLWKYAPILGVKKQSQFAGVWPETLSTKLLILKTGNLQRLLRKTEPIL